MRIDKLVAASNNAGKLAEIAQIMALYGVECISLRAAGIVSDPQESGADFCDNALIKARSAAEKTALPVLADDSGLCVDALGGEPGVHTARYAGEPCDPQRNIDKLLAALAGVSGAAARSARFVCVAALVLPNGRAFTARGECAGSIGTRMVGRAGFGYDPVFVLPDGRSMAQLDDDEKNTVSHRGRALRALVRQLETEGVLL